MVHFRYVHYSERLVGKVHAHARRRGNRAVPVSFIGVINCRIGRFVVTDGFAVAEEVRSKARNVLRRIVCKIRYFKRVRRFVRFQRLVVHRIERRNGKNIFAFVKVRGFHRNAVLRRRFNHGIIRLILQRQAIRIRVIHGFPADRHTVGNVESRYFFQFSFKRSHVIGDIHHADSVVISFRVVRGGGGRVIHAETDNRIFRTRKSRLFRKIQRHVGKLRAVVKHFQVVSVHLHLRMEPADNDIFDVDIKHGVVIVVYRKRRASDSAPAVRGRGKFRNLLAVAGNKFHFAVFAYGHRAVKRRNLRGVIISHFRDGQLVRSGFAFFGVVAVIRGSNGNGIVSACKSRRRNHKLPVRRGYAVYVEFRCVAPFGNHNVVRSRVVFIPYKVAAVDSEVFNRLIRAQRSDGQIVRSHVGIGYKHVVLRRNRL